MRAEMIDPRDQTSQVDDPPYRVYFWDDGGTATEEWQLSNADLTEVLGWISAHSRGRSHSLWVVKRSPGDVCVIRLQGVDLDRADWPSWAHRMTI